MRPDSVGRVSVCELDWAKPEQIAALHPPFDYVLAADCVYHEHIVEHLHRTICDLTTPKSAGGPPRRGGAGGGGPSRGGGAGGGGQASR